MKRIIALILIFICFNGYAQVTEKQVGVAKTILGHFEMATFEQISHHFDESLQDLLTAEKLATIWGQLNAKFGKYKGATKIKTDTSEGSKVVVITCIFEKMNVDLQIVFKESEIAAGIWFAPSKVQLPYKYPSYFKVDEIEEEKIKITTGNYTLNGLLTRPVSEEKSPAVILVHGSGPLDIDESVGPNKPFKDLALGLASAGIVVIRYEKRTKAYPKKMAANFNTLTVKEETIEDVLSALELAKQNEHIDPSKIFVLGHSLGGMLAPRIAIAAPEIAGIIIMAGNSRPLEDIIFDQMKYIFTYDSLSNKEKIQLDNLQIQVNNVKKQDLSAETSSFDLPMGLPASYWLDLKAYDQVAVAKSLLVRILILQGEKDYQVTTKDFEIWITALSKNKNVSLKLYKEVNHLFIEGDGIPEDYDDQGNVAEYVIRDIADWILEK